MKVARLGAVGYLNARPLVHGLDARKDLFSIRFDVPSTCATLLHAGDIDLGMIPSIEYQRAREPYRIVPDLGIVSGGEVASVALFTRVPIEDIRTIGLDTSSRTSAGLTRILCRDAWHIDPRFEPVPPDAAARVEGCDAALLIGDPALFLDHESAGLMKVDLGAEWTRMTGLPFVWAVWAGRADALTPAHVVALQEARDAGVANSDAIADAYCPTRPTPAEGPLHAEAGGVSPKPTHDPVRAKAEVCRAYLRDNIQYGLGEREAAGLRRYYELAARHRIIDAARVADFYEVQADRVFTPGRPGL
jgi:chorismate dehydratase